MSEVNVTIFDRNYRLAVTTGEEKMLEDCARQVNEQMLAVRAAGRVIAIDQIAVLTALELAYDAKKREHDAKKTAAAPPQTPPQPVQQQTPAAAVPTAASTPNEADSALFAEIHSLAVSAKRHSSETQRWDRSSKVISRKPRKCGASYFSWIKFYAAVVFDHLREV